MDIETLRNELTQASELEAARMFNELLRGCARRGLLEAMAQEAELLCGSKYHPDQQSPYRRAGSERGQAYLDGELEEVIGPRVREKEGSEIRLATYQAAKSPERIFDQVVAALEQGLPIRGAERSRKKGSLSKSEASRMWIEKSRLQLEEFRTRSLRDERWLALWIGGLKLADGLWILVAVGVDLDGHKKALDFEQGSSESASVCEALLRRIKERGVVPQKGKRLLICRDGSPALAKAVGKHWPEAIEQECLVHVQRELRDKVRKRDRADLDRHFKTLRDAQGKKAGEEAFEEFLDFVSERNGEAGEALSKRREKLTAFHGLDVTSTLNTTFLSTNVIENVIRNWREATGNVKRWNEKKDMVSRWVASGLLWAEAGFRKVRGYQDLRELHEALAVDGATRPAPPQAVVSLTTPAESDAAAGRATDLNESPKK